PARSLRARAPYRLAGRLRIYTGFEWSNQIYFPVPRPDDQDRLFYYDKRVLAGVQLPLGEHLALDVSAGYSFDRFFFEGKSYSDRWNNRIDLGDGPFAAARLILKW